MKIATIYPVLVYPRVISDECAYIGFIGHCHDIENDFYMRLGGIEESDAKETRNRILTFFNLNGDYFDRSLIQFNKCIKHFKEMFGDDSDKLHKALQNAMNHSHNSFIRIGKPMSCIVEKTLKDTINDHIKEYIITRK